MSNQFRKYLKFGLKQWFRLFWTKQRIGSCGERVYLEDNVRLMRFPKGIHIGSNVALKEGVRICACNPDATVWIGENTTVGYHTFVFSSEQIKIGKNCLIAPFVYLVDSNHQISKETRINLQPNETAPIEIGNDVWIASNVTILKGVTIGDGVVVAANSVVNQSIPAYEIWGGSPAKRIGERK